MSLEPVLDMMRRAEEGGYAVGYFESWSIESLQGVLDAAEQTQSPVIIGFNGEFMSGHDRVLPERLSLYGALGRAAAEQARVPCAFIFNECSQDDWVAQAVTAGFNLVMSADPDAAPADYTRRVKALTEQAHGHGVAVEAEIGELPCGDDAGQTTDPSAAVQFVADTGVDLLAVSVGNVHIKLDGKAGLDLALVARLRESLDVPLVLHGGSGISADALRDAIKLGVTKVNYGTYLKRHYLEALRHALNSSEVNPHRLLGMGGEDDILVAVRQAVRDAVIQGMQELGCCGRSSDG